MDTKLPISDEHKVEIKSHIYRADTDYIKDNTPLFLRGWIFKNIEGQLLTIIEAMGLSEKQENAIKSYVRQAVWSSLDNGSVIVLSPKDDSTITNPIYEARETPSK